jgi:hypothetical protein
MELQRRSRQGRLISGRNVRRPVERFVTGLESLPEIVRQSVMEEAAPGIIPEVVEEQPQQPVDMRDSEVYQALGHGGRLVSAAPPAGAATGADPRLHPKTQEAVLDAGKRGLGKLAVNAGVNALMGGDLVSPYGLASVPMNMIGAGIDSEMGLDWIEPNNAKPGLVSNPFTRIGRTVLGVVGGGVAPVIGSPVGSRVGRAIGDRIDDAGDWRHNERTKDYLEDNYGYFDARKKYRDVSRGVDENENLSPGPGAYKTHEEWMKNTTAEQEYKDGSAMIRDENKSEGMDYGLLIQQQQQQAMKRGRDKEERSSDVPEGLGFAGRAGGNAADVGSIAGSASAARGLGSLF